MKRPVSELKIISGSKQPAILTVIADEEVTGIGEPPAMSTSTDLLLMLDQVGNSPPYFHNAKYLYEHTYEYIFVHAVKFLFNCHRRTRNSDCYLEMSVIRSCLLLEVYDF